MPRLRRLNGQDLLRIFAQFGFTVVRIRGSHHVLRRIVIIDGLPTRQTLNIPVHGSDPVPIGTLRAIYRQACQFIAEEDLSPLFFAD